MSNKQGILRPGDEAEPERNVEIIDVPDYKPKCIPSKTCRDCINKIYEVDPLFCPRCGGEMKIISFITEAPVIRKILYTLAYGTEVFQRSCQPGIHT